MKQENMIVLAAAAAAGFLIWKATRGKATTSTTSAPKGSTSVTDWVGEIFNASGTPYNNGWRYYENGTAIDPQGRYWYQGQLVYTPQQYTGRGGPVA